MPPLKEFKSHEEHIELLRSRGMKINDEEQMLRVLSRVSYYRLSGYWYPYRQPIPRTRKRSDTFIVGTESSDVLALYDFDHRLREAVFKCLGPIELAVRSILGDKLGEIDPMIHLKPEALGARAKKQGTSAASNIYNEWLNRYNAALARSREPFVSHHKNKYDGRLPIWAAVEVTDWGLLSHLYSLSPESVRKAMATPLSLTAPQLGSWLQSLNIVRNYSTHHARMFNSVYAIKPKRPDTQLIPDFAVIEDQRNRCFYQLTMIQHLLTALNVGDSSTLPNVLETFPQVHHVSINSMGVPRDWRKMSLWKH